MDLSESPFFMSLCRNVRKSETDRQTDTYWQIKKEKEKLKTGKIQDEEDVCIANYAITHLITKGEKE